MKVSEVATALNESAQGHPFGKFPSIRKAIQGRKRVNSCIFDINKPSVRDNAGWAFHTGGSGELQFNIGFEDAQERFRYGVAFSFETSRSFPSLEPLIPKVERFNEFIRLNSASLDAYRMWIWRRDKIIKPDTAVRQITEDETTNPTFVFLGKSTPINAIDPLTILNCFEDLLDLYRFVETASTNLSFTDNSSPDAAFQFQERLTIGPGSSAKYTIGQTIGVSLRSNQIKRILYDLLKKSAAGRLGDEIPSGNGGRIDLVCELPSGQYDFYEIKPATLARNAIREALPQLLEYSLREGGHEAKRLIVVSQAELDDASSKFLAALRLKGLPVYYHHIPLQ